MHSRYEDLIILITKSLAPGTLRSYSNFWQRWIQTRRKVSIIGRVTTLLLLRAMQLQGCSATAAAKALSALPFLAHIMYWVEMGTNFLINFFCTIGKNLKGLARTRGDPYHPESSLYLCKPCPRTAPTIMKPLSRSCFLEHSE